MSTFWIYLIADSDTDNRVVYHVHVDDQNEDIPIRAEKLFNEARSKNIGNETIDVTNTIRQWWESLPSEIASKVNVYPDGEAVYSIPTARKVFYSTDFKVAIPTLLNPKLTIR